MSRLRVLRCGMAIACVAAHAVVAVSAEPTGGRVNVALCQTVVLDGDREGNFVRIEAALREAKEQGAQIACLPETAILGQSTAADPEGQTFADAKDRQPDVIVVEVPP